jgi:prepilin-type N-terminal cleavage/methylation domain-containing protein
VNKDGYTLVEMLAAIIMIALAIGGLTQGMRIIGLVQTSAGRALNGAREQRAEQVGLDRLVAGQGPFFSDDDAGLAGSVSQFSFPCPPSTCTASLTATGASTKLVIARGSAQSVTALPKRGQAVFTYIGEKTTGETWPPVNAPHERLTRIELSQQGVAGVAPLASARLWIEEPRDCRFDAIAQACRSASQ